MIILDTKFFGHDSAICLIDTDKKTIFALSTERFTRVEHDQAPVVVMSEFLAGKKIDMMSHSFSDFSEADFCLESNGEGAARAIEDFLKSPHSGKFGEVTELENLPQELREQTQLARQGGVSPEIYNQQQVASVINTLFAHCNQQDIPTLEFYDHHLCHATSAYYSSPFVGTPSLVVSIDGQGDGHFGKAYILNQNFTKEIGRSPLTGVGSLGGYSVGSSGSIYSNFTRAGGFRQNSDEGKIEAWVVFGKPIDDVLDDLISACTIANNSIYLDADKAAAEIADGKVIAAFHGRADFGPRALGNSSILANPADPNIREKLNISIKQRPPWQPFCPSILDSERESLFHDSLPHKHMAAAFRLKDEWRKALPAARHIDGTARPQFVSETDNPAYYRLIEAVKQRTGFGVVLNTSFNLHGRAMVMSPEHAIQDMLDCSLDVLFLEGYRVWKKTGEDRFLPSAKLGEAS